jgi:hypothetical protein
MQRFPAGEKLIATEADLINFAHKEAKAKERDRNSSDPFSTLEIHAEVIGD